MTYCIMSDEDQLIYPEEEHSQGVHEEEKPFFIWGAWSQNITTPLKMDFSQPSKIKNIFLGSSFAIILDQQKCLWSWGFNEHGCLGQAAERKVSKTPEKVALPESTNELFTAVSIGDNHVIALAESGAVYAWGDNRKQQIGIGKQQGAKIWTPVKVEIEAASLPDHVYASCNSSYIVTADGEVFAWGNNNDGQLGVSSLVDIEIPKKIENLPVIDELVIRGKQVIAMQYYPTEEDENSQEGIEEGEIMLPALNKEESKSHSMAKSNIDENLLYPPSPAKHETPGLERGATMKSKSTKSVRSQRSQRSGKSGASSRLGTRGGIVDKLGLALKNIIPVMYELYEEFKKIDEYMEKEYEENIRKDRIRSNPVKKVIDRILKLKQNCYGIFKKDLSMDAAADDKDGLEVKNFISILRKGIVDSMSLRCLQTISMWMQNFSDTLELQSYLNLEKELLEKKNMSIPEKLQKHAITYHCQIVQNKIKSSSKGLKLLSLGFTNASCIVMEHAVNSVLIQSQLWVGFNNVTADYSKQEVRYAKLKNFSEIFKELCSIYEKLSKSSFDKLAETMKFDRKKYASQRDFLEELLKIAGEIRGEGIKKLVDLKKAMGNKFNKKLQFVYKILSENNQLRELLDECNRQLLKAPKIYEKIPQDSKNNTKR